jgi:hypothetical protein
VLILRELAKTFREIVLAEFVSIVKLSGENDYELKLRCLIDDCDKESISEYLQKWDLKMREEKGYMVVYQQNAQSFSFQN